MDEVESLDVFDDVDTEVMPAGRLDELCEACFFLDGEALDVTPGEVEEL